VTIVLVALKTSITTAILLASDGTHGEPALGKTSISKKATPPRVYIILLTGQKAK